MADKIPLGITVPLRQGSNGYFEQSFDSMGQAKTNLENLLRTRKGERPLQPLYGSDLHSLIFDNNVEETAPIMEDIIRKEVRFWNPNIIIETVEVDRSISELDTYTADIKIKFSMNDIPNSSQILQFSINS